MSGTWRVYAEPSPEREHGDWPEPVDTADGATREPDRFVHPDSWGSEAEAQEALDHMAWCAIPWMCSGCWTTRKTAAGTGFPAGWTSRSVPRGIDIRCAACREAGDDQPE